MCKNRVASILRGSANVPLVSRMGVVGGLADKKWVNEGMLYGIYDKYKGYPIGLIGYVSRYDNGDKEVTLTTENNGGYPFMRIFF